jgi:hypothetical protein
MHFPLASGVGASAFTSIEFSTVRPLIMVRAVIGLADSSIAKLAIAALQNQIAKLGFAGDNLTFIVIGAGGFILSHTAEPSNHLFRRITPSDSECLRQIQPRLLA